MSELFQLVGKIVIDTTEANKAIDETMEKVDALNKKLGKETESATVATTTSGTTGGTTKSTQAASPVSTQTASSAGTSYTSTVAGDVAAANAATGVFNDIMSWVGKNFVGGVQTNFEKQEAIASLSAFIGEEHAAVAYQELLDYSMNSTFGISDLLNSTKMLLAQNMPFEEVLETIRMFADVTQGNSERANSMLWNYSQVLARGRMDATEEKDFAKAGLSIPSILEEMTGKPRADWNKQMSEGMLTPDLVKMALEYATSEGGTFYGQMEKVMGSAYGQKEKAKNLWEQLWANFADPISDVLGGVVLPVGNFAMEKAVDNKHATNFLLNAGGAAVSTALKTSTIGANVPGVLGKFLSMFGSNAFSNALGAASGLGMLYSIYDYGVEARKETAAKRTLRHEGYATAAEGVENMNAGNNPVFMPTLQNAARILGEYWANEDFNTFADEDAVIRKLFGFDDGRMGYDPAKMEQMNAALRTFGFEGNSFTGENMDMLDIEMWLDSLGVLFQQMNMQTPEQQQQLGQLSSKMDTMNSNINTTNSLLQTIAANSGQPIYLDSGALVGNIGPALNDYLGNIVSGG